MALNVAENSTEVVQRVKVDIQRELPDSNPFLKNSWVGAFATAFANRVYDLYFALKQAFLEAIPDTAVLNLKQWAAIWNITQNAATISTGNVAVSGIAGGLISKDSETLTTWVSSDGKRYSAIEDGVIVLQSLTVASITRAGSIATLTTDNDHFIASNIKITVTGAVETEYNVTGATCTVTSAKKLTFTVTGTPATPATGTILLAFTSVSIAIASDDFGKNKNQLFDTILDLESPITDVDNTVSVDFGELGNGADIEVDESIRFRLLNRIQNPIAHFNVAEIEAIVLGVGGVTRVFVQEITPGVGQVTIYFMRDNDDDPIPSVSEIATVKEAVDSIKPANTDTLDAIVLAPNAVITNYVFSAISPDSIAMRTAIAASLKQFYAERVDVDITIVKEAYNAGIFNTIDVNGVDIDSFTLSSPSGDITILAAEIGKLGNITYT
jgi:uncharacterized phage protein gp47/JayE